MNLRWLSESVELLRRVYVLSRPFGRRKLAITAFLTFLQGLFQVLGVTSIFPFLAFAANPQVIANSQWGGLFQRLLPDYTHNQMLVFLGCIAIGVIVLANLVNILADYNRTAYAQSLAHWLRGQMMSRFLSQPYSYFLRNDSAILLKKVIGDVLQYTNGLLAALLDLAGRLMTAFFLIVTLFLVDPVIALSIFSMGGLFYGLVFLSLRGMRRRINQYMKVGERGTAKTTQEVLGGIKPILIHRKESHFSGVAAVFSHALAKGERQRQLAAILPRYFLEPLAFGGIIALVVVYALSGRDFASLIPTLGVVGFAGYRLLPSLNLIYSQVSKINTTKYALDEVYDELIEAEAPPQELTSSQLEWHKAIHLKNLTFSHPGAFQPALNDITVTIPRGTKTAFIGATGSGKSTLIDCLLGLHVPTSGQILIDDTPLAGSYISSWRSKIGYVPQDIFLFSDSITANIALGVPDEDIDMGQVMHAARLAQIADFIETELPEGYSTEVGERGVRLSGGQRQRIGLARALYHTPEVLILDEATSALDNETEAALMESINQLDDSITIVMVAHRLSTVANCSSVYELNKGRLVLSHESIESKNG